MRLCTGVTDKGQIMGETVWHDGWPRKEGWYRCLLDGEEEMNLKYYMCTVSMKKHWVDSHGDYIETMAHVQWSDEKPTGVLR